MLAAAGLPLLAGGEAPGVAGKRECGCVLQPGKPGRRVQRNEAGIIRRENQRGAIYLCGRARYLSTFRYALGCVRDVMVGEYGGFGKCASRIR
jgi:hypothetical protein